MKINTHNITRNDFTKIINEGLYKVGAEIGVAEGNYSKYLLANSNIQKMYLVDPFDSTIAEYYCTEQVTKDNLKDYADRIVILPMTSESAAKEITDNSLDFVYVDGDHRYAFAKQDMELWFPKVKPGGMFAGHDYHPAQPGVVKAITEFCDSRGFELNLTGLAGLDQSQSGKEGGAPSWFLYKV